MEHELWSELGEMAGVGLTGSQIEKLGHYRDWLVGEAIVAGGLGPREQDRVDTRHIADSLMFGVVMPHVPEEIWDLGSGVGLPGIPLAILYPETRLILVERSGRRSDLLSRVVRVLGLSNVEVSQSDAAGLTGPIEAMVSRAALGPEETARMAHRVLAPGGFAVMAGSWREAPSFHGWTTMEIRPVSLDHPVWLLIMRRQ